MIAVLDFVSGTACLLCIGMDNKRYILYYIFGWIGIITGLLIALFGVLYVLTDKGPEYGFSLASVVGLGSILISLLPMMLGILLVVKGRKRKNTIQS